jgi:PAS domain S-box-containing protein
MSTPIESEPTSGAASAGAVHGDDASHAARDRAILDAALDAVVTIDADGCVLAFNAAAERMFGYARAEAIGRDVADLIVPLEDRTAYRAAFRRHLATNDGVVVGCHVESRARRADGSELPVEVAIIPIEVGGAATFTWFLRELDDRNGARQALYETESRFRALIEYGSDLISVIESDGTIGYASPSHERLLGYAPDELLGTNAMTLVHPDDRALVAPAFDGATADEPSMQPVTFRFRHRDGSWRYLEGLARKVGLRAIVVNSRDITERKRAEDELMQTRAEAIEASRLKSEFISTMSHELRTPLNIILGYADILAAELEAADREAALAHIRKAGGELLEMIETTLEASRLAAGRDLTSPEPIVLAELWSDLAAELAVLPRKLGVELRCELVAAGELRTDRQKLRTILLNLVGNACKFTSAGTIEVRCERVGADCVFVVRDTGIGIPAEALPHVFEMFRRADASYTRAYTGIGLGLYIVRQLVDQLGGEISVETAPGIGTTFRVRLPPFASEDGSAALSA